MATISVPGGAAGGDEDEAMESQLASLAKLPTVDRLRTAVVSFDGEDGKKRAEQIDVTKLTVEDRHRVVERILRVTDEDNEQFLRNLRGRLDRVGVKLPTIEVRYDHLKVEALVYQRSRAIPSLPNFFKSVIEWPWQMLGITKKVKANVLSDVSGILKPTRLTLLLGPPGSGRTTFLRALAGRLTPDLQVSGEITYNGHHLSEFVPQRTSAYISQYDLQTSELTVRENLDFYRRVQGVGSTYDMLEELYRREKEANVMPETDSDLFFKATAVIGQSTNLTTDYIMKLMGLDICADTQIGDAMRRGISGGQKKRVSAAEMLVGPAKAFFMDEMSTGLDSSTTFQITKMLQQIVHIMDRTVVVSLLQPPPETYDLFDDLILLADGQVVYQGPCSNVLEFMTYVGFKCPHRKATADFLQEVTSRKDQRQYWADKSTPYEYVSVSKFAERFKSFHAGQRMATELATPFDKSESHPAALVHKKYAVSKLELLKACFARELILMKRHIMTYVIKIIQIAIVAFMAGTLFFRTTLHHGTVDNANVYLGAIFFCCVFVMTAGLAEQYFTITRLSVYYKEKGLFLYPAWALSIPMFLLRIPWTFLEAGVYLIIVYFTTGFSPEPGRFFRLFLILVLLNQSFIATFRLTATAGRSALTAENFGHFIYAAILTLGGFVVSVENLPKWWRWASWLSVLQYAQEAVSLNEFLSKEWDKPFGDTTLGVAALRSRGLRTAGSFVWISIAALVAYIILLNVLVTLCLQYLNPPAIVRSSAVKSSKAVEESEEQAPFGTISFRRSSARLSSSRSDNLFRQGSRGLPDILFRQRSRGLQEISSARVSSANFDNDRLPDSREEPRLSVQYDGVLKRPSGLDGDGVPDGIKAAMKGVVLPFLPRSISFNNISYYVDMPDTMKAQGVSGDKLQLLNNVSGSFRPGWLTALVGVSGAGKTTLLDVLAGRKTRGYVEGDIFISGYRKQQSTFTRIAGYCEQNDIHSPNVTVFESLVFSAWMRLSPKVDKQTRMMFVEEVMSLVELDVLRNFVVGLPGQSGLSTEQRKRLTIAVELVANPSIIFMDEPTSGLDARAAAIVMRAVRNIGDTGRTVVCTIHQPSIDIFEAFDELLLLTRGGKSIYAGPLGRNSRHLIEYFQAISGVPKIKDGYNPCAWMLDVSSPSMEAKLGVDFAEIYNKSYAYENNAAVVKHLSKPTASSKDLEFPTVYAQSFWEQFRAGLWKMGMSYWRNTTYTGVKFVLVIVMSAFLGSIFWGIGSKRGTQQDVFNIMGAAYSTVFFLGINFALTVVPIILIERIAYYRERGAGMYSPWTYAISQFLIEWPYVFCQSVIVATILYSMIQFEWRYDKFLWFLFFTFFTFLFFVYFGMVVAAATPNGTLAVITATSLFGIFSLFSGFTITIKQIPAWWRWLYWCNPIAWSLYGFVGSQLSDVETYINLPDSPGQITVKEYLSTYFGFHNSFLKYVAIEQVMLCVTLAVTFALCITHCKFQRR